MDSGHGDQLEASLRYPQSQWRSSLAPAGELDQLIYRSNLLGSDLRITNFGGGNTSCKEPGTDPVTGAPLEILWIKGSGGDLGTLDRRGIAALDNSRILTLTDSYPGSADEDAHVALIGECLIEPRRVAPSIDTPIHAVIPARHVDHVHPDAVIALATAVGGKEFVAQIYGDEVGWVDWIRPGYELANAVRLLIRERPTLRGIVLGKHGLLSWAEDAFECYERTLRFIESAARFIDSLADARSGPVFPVPDLPGLDVGHRRRQAAAALPIFRNLTSTSERRTLAHFRDDASVLEFASSANADRLIAEGTSCPDHFLRTKRRALLLDLPPDADPAANVTAIAAAFDAYRDDYRRYYTANSTGTSPAMRSANPAVILWPGVGMFTIGASTHEARIIGEFFASAVNVMRGAETISQYRGLSESEAFGVEYWSLEEAKLQRLPKAKPMAGRVALITGAAGGIGSAIARRFAAEGACVILVDLDLEGVERIAADLGDQALALSVDITNEERVADAFRAAILAFGGVDLVVNNAGYSLSKALVDTEAGEYQNLHAVIALGSFLVTRAMVRLAFEQGVGGDVVYVVSKNAVVAGANNVAYASAKAAQLHQMRLLAAELAPMGIRVNAVNPDAVVRDSKLFAGDWGDDRAATYGVERAKLGEFYAGRSLLGREVLPEDVATACFLLVAGGLDKTTGAVIPVDAGVAPAFMR